MRGVKNISIQVLCHATEDVKKVIKAVENVIGEEVARNTTMDIEVLEGHYGDPVSLIKIFLQDQESSEEALLKILSRLSRGEREEVWRDRSKRGKHGGKLYLRLDKQLAFKGQVRLSDKDPIRMVVDFRGDMDALRRRIEARLAGEEGSLERGE